ncbi:hypothetical protein DBIPINDM_008414 (plasmid) [Mesorhizobium sp. AR02]|uniref:hypothetical protein n=1 Tax=Mesorhizobium sp. AR02 TaxID=2865837 RepID=UPI00215EECBA|nr:hypothetical protein [Mesorhizobium sp. AR02]UVK57450.1 hypothetical protein DBIPINDM_008414 [Mesorhizobium sp. AR02]
MREYSKRKKLLQEQQTLPAQPSVKKQTAQQGLASKRLQWKGINGSSFVFFWQNFSQDRRAST